VGVDKVGYFEGVEVGYETEGVSVGVDANGEDEGLEKMGAMEGVREGLAVGKGVHEHSN